MRRRPARVEFCEADVHDAFDAWRRAVGIHRAEVEAAGEVTGQGVDAPVEEAPRARARESLSTHLDRVIVRLTSLRAGETPEAWDAVLDEFVRALDAMHPAARRARGEARERLLADLEALDARLLERARAVVEADVLAQAAREATAELEPFATRLSPAAYLAAHQRCEHRALRERLRLPTLILD
jgi:predicted DsbA family dithiol-disulfide isomerase